MTDDELRAAAKEFLSNEPREVRITDFANAIAISFPHLPWCVAGVIDGDRAFVRLQFLGPISARQYYDVSEHARENFPLGFRYFVYGRTFRCDECGCKLEGGDLIDGDDYLLRTRTAQGNEDLRYCTLACLHTHAQKRAWSIAIGIGALVKWAREKWFELP